MSSRSISLSYILILYSHRSQVFQVASYLQVSLLTACTHYFSPIRDTRPTQLVLGIKYVKVVIIQFSQIFCYFFRLGSNISLIILLSNPLILGSSFRVRGQGSRPCDAGKVVVLYILISVF